MFLARKQTIVLDTGRSRSALGRSSALGCDGETAHLNIGKGALDIGDIYVENLILWLRDL